MIVYAINLDYRCNERCVFCAADLGGDVPRSVRAPSLTLGRISDWLRDRPPTPADHVLLSGGEPTLHRELLSIVRHIAAFTPNVALFTNGVRLSDVQRAHDVAAAGVRRFEISLFGPSGASHDAITRRRGSFAATLEGLRNLDRLRATFPLVIAVRLLIARHTALVSAETARAVLDAGIRPDWFSLNRTIISQDAAAAGAPISWAEARAPVNETIRVVRRRGSSVDAPTVPLCVLDEDNRRWLETLNAGRDGYGTPAEQRYLDPLQPVDAPPRRPRARAALLDVCLDCASSAVCPRVERSYVTRFGAAGLRALPVAVTR